MKRLSKLALLLVAITLQLSGMTSETTVQLNRDIYSSAGQPSTMQRCESAADLSAGCPVTYTFTPLTYPYPLDSNGLPNPNLVVPKSPTKLTAGHH